MRTKAIAIAPTLETKSARDFVLIVDVIAIKPTLGTKSPADFVSRVGAIAYVPIGGVAGVTYIYI